MPRYLSDKSSVALEYPCLCTQIKAAILNQLFFRGEKDLYNPTTSPVRWPWEKFNRTLKAQLSKFVDQHQRDWDEHVPLLLMAYRTSAHNTTGVTPAKMMMRRDLRLPIDLFVGRPSEEVPVHRSAYAQQLHNHLERIHSFA